MFFPVDELNNTKISEDTFPNEEFRLVDECADNTIKLINEYLNTPNDYLTESGYVDFSDIKDSARDLINLITKGKDAMAETIKQSAMEANNYKDQLNRISTTKRKAGYEMIPVEEYTSILSTGIGGTAMVKWKSGNLAHVKFDWNRVIAIARVSKNKNDIRNYIYKEAEEIIEKVGAMIDIFPRTTIKKNVQEVAKMLSDKIDLLKGASIDAERYTNEMKKNLQDGISVLDREKNSDEQNKKLIVFGLRLGIMYLKMAYNHNWKLVNTINRCVIKQSREVKRIINKYAD